MRIKFATLILLILLAACGAKTATPTQPPTATPPPGVTLTPTPGAPLAILIVPADMPQDQSSLYQTTVYTLAQGSAMRFQVRNALTADDLAVEPSLKVVIAFPPDPGLAALSAAAPAVQFLAVNVDEDRGGVPDFVKEENWTIPVAYAQGLDHLLGVRSLPTLVIFDRSGRVIFRQEGMDPVGFVDTVEKKLREALEQAAPAATASR